MKLANETHASLLKRVRLMAQHAETIAKACRIIEQELTVPELLARAPDATKIVRSIRAVEMRARQLVNDVLAKETPK